MEPILSLRATLLCALAGAVLGVLMIVTRTGPGLSALQTPNTAETRNETRRAILTELADALTRYAQESGQLPVTLSPRDTEICSSRGANCETVKLVDLSFLVSHDGYLNNIPSDPSGGYGRWTTGFTISSLPDGRIRLAAPRAENGASISVIK
jgi:hypothetical protein